MQIHGRTVDAQGRCAHWHSPLDVVANRCATCAKFWACSICHDEACDHPFGPAGRRDQAVLCGACGTIMDYEAYTGYADAPQCPQCPQCGHPFNPGCATHRDIYFLGD